MATANPTFVSGLRGSDMVGTDERPKNFREAILWLDPNGMTPITALTARTTTETTDDPEFAWWEELQAPKKAVLTAASGGTGGTDRTTFTVAATVDEANGVYAITAASQFKVGDLLRLFDTTGSEPTSYGVAGSTEIVRVTAVSGNDLTITRNVADSVSGGTAGSVGVNVATPANWTVQYIGSAYAEGSTSPDSVFAKPEKFLNYTQIFKTSFQVTGTASSTKYRTGDLLQNDKKRAMFKHAEGLEQALMWGIKREMTDGSGQKLRLTSGLRDIFSTNVNAAVGNITDDFFLDTISPLFNFNAGGAGDQRICILGNGALNAIQKMVRDTSNVRINYEGKINFMGMKMLEYTIPQGTIFLKSHPMLNVDPVFSKSMFVLNGKGLIRRPLKGRDTKIQSNIQANDADTRKDQWLTEVGFEIHFERTQGYFGGITAA